MKKIEKLADSGHLADLPSRYLLDRLNRDRFSGHLLLSANDKKKKIWFHQGEIFKIQTNLVPELFGHMMIERGWLNEADLKSCLELQKDLLRTSNVSKKLGQWVSELYGIGSDEVEELSRIQFVNSFLQAMTWFEGEYQLHPIELRADQAPIISFREMVSSIQSLFELDTESSYSALFKLIKPWNPRTMTLELSQIPLWMVMAGCQRAGSNGILTIRKQNKLFEIVVKNGIPLLLYEGTFGQPRQTLIVRKTSDEHEKFFIDQVFRLFSFLAGTVTFRPLGQQNVKASEASLQILDEEGEEKTHKATQVTRSVNAQEAPLELSPKYFAKPKFISKIFKKFKNLSKILDR